MSRPFNVRMEDDLRKRMQEQAEDDGVNESTWAREALAGVIELGGLVPLAAALGRIRRKAAAPDAPSTNGDSPHPAPHPARAIAVQSRSIGAEGRPECIHPKTGLKRLPYATMCGVCGVRVR